MSTLPPILHAADDPFGVSWQVLRVPPIIEIYIFVQQKLTRGASSLFFNHARKGAGKQNKIDTCFKRSVLLEMIEKVRTYFF